jgi:hypothetical protein
VLSAGLRRHRGVARSAHVVRHRLDATRHSVRGPARSSAVSESPAATMMMPVRAHWPLAAGGSVPLRGVTVKTRRPATRQPPPGRIPGRRRCQWLLRPVAGSGRHRTPSAARLPPCRAGRAISSSESTQDSESLKGSEPLSPRLGGRAPPAQTRPQARAPAAPAGGPTPPAAG